MQNYSMILLSHHCQPVQHHCTVIVLVFALFFKSSVLHSCLCFDNQELTNKNTPLKLNNTTNNTNNLSLLFANCSKRGCGHQFQF